MATTTTTLFSFLFLALCCLSIQNVCSSKGHTLHFHNSLIPDPEDTIYINCYINFRHVLRVDLTPGQNSEALPIELPTRTLQCHVNWFTNLADFKAYTPKRDVGNNNLYWNFNDTGVFLAYDNSTFKQIAGWYPE